MAEVSPDRVAIVTGGSRGIGRGVAQRLGKDGYSVVVNYASNVEQANEVVANIKSAGGQAIAFAADVAEPQAISDLFDLAESTFGGIDVLVNAAGKMSLAPLAEMDLAVLDEMHRINIRGTFVVNQQAARRLRPGGAIVNFSSSVLGRDLPNYTGYAASKGAVEAFTFILANELRGKDINVNAVAPGPTATEMFLEGKNEAMLTRFAAAAPLGRLGQPADIAAVVAFLVSPEGHWTNGQVIRVNGGVN
jgi:3-oxoacyl-[acyl-carrier protein] reductase